MRIFTWLLISVIILITLTRCGSSSLPDGEKLVTRARQVWEADWHAVWQIEWAGAPVKGSLIAEVWHATGNRLRIETLEAPTAALSGLTLVNNGTTTWLYDLRQNRVETGPEEWVRIPLASDALDAIDWLLLNVDGSTINVTSYETLESGPATRLDIIQDNGDLVMLWVHDVTGLPARVTLRSAIWGEATFTTRSISTGERPHPALFVPPEAGSLGRPPDIDVVR